MSDPCQRLRQTYEEIKTLKNEFVLAYAEATDKDKTRKEAKPAIKQAWDLKTRLEEKRKALAEMIIAPCERILRLREQYERQRHILEHTGILEKLSSGEMGIKAIDGKEYPFPSYGEIAQRMRKNREMIETKAAQGFTELIIVPFGMKLDDLIEKYKAVILKHYAGMPDPQDPKKRIPDPAKTKLFATKENPSDPDEPLALNEKEPVWVWEGYKNADISGKLVYFPEAFSENHSGKTKKEILADRPSSAWQIILAENLPNIPRKGKGEEKGGRKQPEAGLTPNEYLAILKTDPRYRHETGMTPEEQIVYAIKHLEETNQVIDDYGGKDSISYQLGAYFPPDGDVPYAYWLRGDQRAYLVGSVPSGRDDRCGVRPAVMV